MSSKNTLNKTQKVRKIYVFENIKILKREKNVICDSLGICIGMSNCANT